MILITQLAHELKRPIIYVSHDYSEITRLASHVSFVEEGQFQPIQTLKNIEVVP
ncbi:MAG: hypothetical protein NTW94_08065 [Legionellales bacterium]|nr:hypothetical protein [Legionellales bacterium]